jgi:hypothetical protein
VWSDCVRCPKNDHCDEIAVVRTLEDVPVPAIAAAEPTPKGVSIPVLGPFAAAANEGGADVIDED